ncbi:LysR substrate-binding domain-containing protein [Kocuria rhizophila]|uniref:LysR substrate-binding domain-containing protein n=1 Tax=Kocuria rhizophila TaxID=72000 RepID=UPI002E167B46
MGAARRGDRCRTHPLFFTHKRAIGPGLERLPLFTERLVVSVTSSDSRARQESVTLADLADGTVAVCATAPTATGELWSTTAHMPRTISVANTGEWLTRIAVGDAIGITAEATTHNHRAPEVVYLPIEDAPPVTVALTWPGQRRSHPQVVVFATCAQDYFTRLIDIGSPPRLLSTGADGQLA